jgi:hypothetical protein
VRRIVLLLLVSLTACAKKAPPPKAEPEPPDPKKELLAKVRELYGALEHQEPERLNDILTADVMAYGLGPKESFTNRDTLIEFMRNELVPFGLRGDTIKISKTDPKVGLARGEDSGWFYDFPRFDRVRSDKPTQTWKVRITGHAVRDEGKWRIDAVHVSFGFPDTDLYAADAPKKLKPPEAVGTDKATDAEQVITLTKRMLEDIGVKIERTSDATEVVLIGTDPTDVFEGGAKFKELARPKLPELKKAAFSLKIEDGPRGRMAPDKKSGWVSAAVVLRLGKPPKVQVLPSFRALWIFADENGALNLVSEHQSLGLTYEQRKPNGDEPDAAAR